MTEDAGSHWYVLTFIFATPSQSLCIIYCKEIKVDLKKAKKVKLYFPSAHQSIGSGFSYEVQ